MARLQFGGGIADWLIQSEEEATTLRPVLLADTPVTFWDELEDGQQYTDLLDGGGSPVAQIDTDENGFLPLFSGPDDDPEITYMYAQAGAGPRVIVTSSDVGAIVLEASQTAMDAAADAESAATTVAGFETRLTDVETLAAGNEATNNFQQLDINDNKDDIADHETRIETLESVVGSEFLTIDSLIPPGGNDEPVMVGHRSGRRYLPENSMISIRDAYEHGLRVCEIDVWANRRDELIVMHDETTSRTASPLRKIKEPAESTTIGGGHANVHNLTGSTRKFWGLDYKKDPNVFSSGAELVADTSWPIESIPSLRDVFEEFAGKMVFWIEIKNQRAGQIVHELVQEYRMENSVIICVFPTSNYLWLQPAAAEGLRTLVFAQSVLSGGEIIDLQSIGVTNVNYAQSVSPALGDIQNLISEGFQYSQSVGARWTGFRTFVNTANDSGTNLMSFAMSDYPRYLGRFVSQDAATGGGGSSISDEQTQLPIQGGWVTEGMFACGDTTETGSIGDKGIISTNPDWTAAKWQLPRTIADASGNDVRGFHVPWNSMIENPTDSFRVSFAVHIVQGSSSDIGGRFGLAFGLNTDGSFQSVSEATSVGDPAMTGYFMWYRQDGNAFLARNDGGNSCVSLGSQSFGGTYSGAGDTPGTANTRRITVDVTPSQITWGRSAAGDQSNFVTSTSVADTNFRGPHIYVYLYRIRARITDIYIEPR